MSPHRTPITKRVVLSGANERRSLPVVAPASAEGVGAAHLHHGLVVHSKRDDLHKSWSAVPGSQSLPYRERDGEEDKNDAEHAIDENG